MRMDVKKNFELFYKSHPLSVAENDLEATGISKRILYKFLQLLDDRNYRIVDFGCGRGVVLYCLEKLGYRNLYGIDLCDVIPSNLLKYTKFTEGDVVGSKFESNYFDGLLSTQTIEHINENLFVNELSRVLKPNGVALIASVLKSRHAWYFYKNFKGERVIERTHLKEYRSVEEYRNIFMEKFEIIDVETSQLGCSIIHHIFHILFKFTRLEIFREAPAKYSLLKKLRKIEVPILGYHTIAILLRKRS